MALELRPNCEYCDKDLPPDAAEARICTFECTLLRRLRRAILEQCLPQLRRRLRAPADQAGAGVAPGLSLAKRPASTRRVGLSYSREDIAAFVAKIMAIPPEKR